MHPEYPQVASREEWLAARLQLLAEVRSVGVRVQREVGVERGPIPNARVVGEEHEENSGHPLSEVGVWVPEIL